MIALGWLLAFLNLDAVNDSGTSDVLVGGSLIRLFEPERGVVAFGFLGAYFFGVNAVLRSYLRGDLRPKAYNQITARILIVVVLSSLLSITNLGDEAVVLGLAFFAGIIPDTVLQLIAEQLPIRSVRVDETEPLTDLEGIDIYDRARLAEEGVTNVEALAHGDLIELLLQTRIPPQRLVDWVDQAILPVHLGNPSCRAAGGIRAARHPRCDGPGQLRQPQVRLATALRPSTNTARCTWRCSCSRSSTPNGCSNSSRGDEHARPADAGRRRRVAPGNAPVVIQSARLIRGATRTLGG